MKVFLAGATGAIGKRLVPALRDAGYVVAALTRSSANAARLRSAGAYPVVADIFDRAAITRSMQETRPDVVIHQLTALTGVTNYKNFDRAFAVTNRLRTEGTDILFDAARAAAGLFGGDQGRTTPGEHVENVMLVSQNGREGDQNEPNLYRNPNHSSRSTKIDFGQNHQIADVKRG